MRGVRRGHRRRPRRPTARPSARVEVQTTDARVAGILQQRQAVLQRDPVLRTDRVVPGGPRLSAGRHRDAEALPLLLRAQRLRRRRAPGRDRLGKRHRRWIPDGGDRPQVEFGFRSPGRGTQDVGKVSDQNV